MSNLQKTVDSNQRRGQKQLIIQKTFKLQEIPEAETRSAGLPV